MKLEEARARIQDLDTEIVRLCAERVKAARQAGRSKQEQGQPTVDFAQERKVLERVRQEARRHGLPEDVAEEVATRLIAASVGAQEEDRVAAAAPGKGRTAVVVGGAGRMGGWLVRFLADSGFGVLVVDKMRKAAENQPGQEALPTADLVLAAVPPQEVAKLYKAWAEAETPPRGVVADIASVKTPLVPAIRALQKAGAKVASFHPLFGPSQSVLRGSDVVLCRTGDKEAEEAVRRLFSPTTARIVEMDLEEHDRRMAEVLSLAHATALSFATALGPEPPGLHSTTARRLEALAGAVVHESPEVYFEIQAGNPHSEAAIARLHTAVSRLRRVVQARDAPGFLRIMDEGRARLDARKEADP